MSTAMKQPIRIGFIGLSSSGWAALALVPPLLEEPLSSQYKLTAISTTRAESAESVSEEYTKKTGSTVKGYHGSPEQIAADPDVDLVAVSVDVPDHKKAILPALEHGKAVFSEWPLGRSLQETEELAEAAKKAGVRTLIGLQVWQSDAVASIRSWIADGKIGRVLGVSWVSHKPLDVHYWSPRSQKGKEWVIDPNNGATTLVIRVGHDLSGFIRMLGLLTSVTAVSGKSFNEVQLVENGQLNGETHPHAAPDHFSVIATLKDHPGALFTGVWRSGVPLVRPGNKHRPAFEAVIEGTEGSIRFDSDDPTGNFWYTNAPKKIYVNEEEVVFQNTGVARSPGKQWEEFAKGEAGDYPSWDDAVKHHRLVDAIERSTLTGQRIFLDV